MTAPIEAAYTALAEALEAALVDAGLIGEGRLERDPTAMWDPEGEEGATQSAAALFKLETKPVRDLMGGGVRRFVVERECRLELASWGPVDDGEDTHEARLDAAIDAVAPLPETDPTLGQTCERLELTDSADEEFWPSGLKRMVTFTIRLRAGDRLGRTAP